MITQIKTFNFEYLAEEVRDAMQENGRRSVSAELRARIALTFMQERAENELLNAIFSADESGPPMSDLAKERIGRYVRNFIKHGKPKGR